MLKKENNLIAWCNSQLVIRKTSFMTFFIFMMFATQSILQWPLLMYWNMHSNNWGDLKIVLELAECSKKIGLDIYKSGEMNNCGEYSFNYLYGRFLIYFINILHLRLIPLEIIGYFFLFIFSYCIASLWPKFNTFRLMEVLTLLLVIFSPISMLLAERANFDILIIWLILISLKKLHRDQELVGLLLLCLASLMKFYTIPLVLLYLLHAKKIRTRVLAIPMLILLVLSTFNDLQLISKQSVGIGADVESGYYQAFGFRAIVLDANFTKSVNWDGVGVWSFSLIVLILTMVLTLKSFNFHSMEEVNVEDISFVKSNLLHFYFFAVPFYIFFFFGSTEYRLIFLLLSFCALSKTDFYDSNITNTIYVLMLVAFWLTKPSGRLDIFGDMAIEVLVIMNLIYFLKNFSFLRNTLSKF